MLIFAFVPIVKCFLFYYNCVGKSYIHNNIIIIINILNRIVVLAKIMVLLINICSMYIVHIYTLKVN